MYDDGGYYIYAQDMIHAADIAGMFDPVECAHCRRPYDLGKVEVTSRYVDCSVWTTPCCSRQVDDRGPGWSSTPMPYTPIDKTAYGLER